MTFLFTSESVGRGHPDKLCDQISDTLLDHYLIQDPNSRVAIECACKNKTIYVFGEVSSKAKVDIEAVVKSVVKEVDYGDSLDYNEIKVVVNLTEQSCYIARAVNFENNGIIINNGVVSSVVNNNVNDKDVIDIKTEMAVDDAKKLDSGNIKDDRNSDTEILPSFNDDDKENNNNIHMPKKPKLHFPIISEPSNIDTNNVEHVGAGDQGMVFGYATNETSALIPLTLLLSHHLVKKLNDLATQYNFLKPDCKSQVTVEYDEKNGALIPLRIDTIVLSVMHTLDINLVDLRSFLLNKVIKTVVDEQLLVNTKYILQPGGLFLTGGPIADAGLTGRKIVVDQYGGFGMCGGGAFSGKDASKVDRTGSYYARYIAKSLVKAKLCSRVTVQLGFAIGLERPVSVYVDSYGSGNDDVLIEVIKNNFDLRVGSMINELELRRPVFKETAVYGHFGRNGFSWEKLRILKILKR